MRTTSTPTAQGFQAKAISGIHTVLIALDCPEARRNGLKGFAIQREAVGAGSAPKWLRSKKVFKSVELDPKNARDPNDPTRPKRFYTLDHPVQSFLWGDYAASPDTLYRFKVVPMYGPPGALEAQPALEFEIRTEKEFDQGHGVWFNRGAIASQAFADQFKNEVPKDMNDPSDPEVAWLSRGLLEACLRYIDDTPAGDGLRVAAYEFTYPPVLNALKRALDRGVDVRIVYHNTTAATKTEKRANESAIAAAGIPKKRDDRQVLFARSKTKIPHNKFIVRLAGGTQPVEVWTGSTNFTASGFLGQTNVGHRVADEATAAQYLAFWELLRGNPALDKARAGTLKLTPNPPAVIGPKTIVQVFSPRAKSDLLKWYGDRTLNSVGSVMFTAAFGVAKQLVEPIAQKRDVLRFVLMEKPATTAVKAQLTKDRSHVLLSYGVPLGELYRMKDGKPTTRKRIQEFALDKWYFKEELYRKKNEGFVFFVHTKFLLIDPLSDDPLVCSGSANFSSNSLLQNDENMLLIRGDTRVADIYMTEFDRIFRHFYFRNIANELEAKGNDAGAIFLDETSGWTDPYFKPTAFKSLRRKMFFAQPTTTWFANAALPLAPPARRSGPRRPKPVKGKRTQTRKAETKKSRAKKTAKAKKR
jgi:phosphatidylserine/phosphatidylglycerophosphate/cardiolipin synthase-like enzyme